MSIIKLEPKTKKPDLVVNYLGTDYVLIGNITASMLERMFDAQDDEGDKGFLKMFLADVVPTELKKVIPQDDLTELAKLWMGHINGPKESGSKK